MAVIRWAAWVQTTLLGPSTTAALISSARWAGRQWSTTACGAASASRTSSMVKSANAARRRAASSSCPIDVQTSV